MDTILSKNADRYRNDNAFATPSVRLRFFEVERAVSTTAQWLQGQGCRERDRIAALTLNCIEAIVLEWATYRLKGIWVGIPSRMREPSDVKAIVAATKPSLLFIQGAALERSHGHLSDPHSWDEFQEVNGKEVSALPQTGRLDFSSFSILRNNQPGDLPNLPKDQHIVRFRYTSGVSGEPKGIVYTDATRKAIQTIINNHIIKDSREVMIHALPIAWASGSLIAPVFAAGGANVVIAKWDVRSFVAAALNEKCTLTFLVPRTLSALVTYSERSGAGWAKSLKRVFLAGAPTPVRIMRRARKMFPHVQFYITLGMTEASFPITWHQVTDEDVSQNNRALIPLGHYTDPYKKSKLQNDQLHVEGNAVALGEWEKQGSGHYHLREFNGIVPTGDLVEVDDMNVLHYLGREKVPWNATHVWLAPHAVEALLEDCRGVKRARVDWMCRSDVPSKPVAVDVTVNPTSAGVSESTIHSFFQSEAASANLQDVQLGSIRFAKVEVTASGKIRRDQ